MQKILSRFIINERDEHRKLTMREHWVVLQTPTGSRIIQIERVEDFREGSEKPEEQASEAPERTLLISELTKGEFRLQVRKEYVDQKVQDNGGADLDRIDKIVQQFNRWMRKNLGGLQYTKQNAKKAIELYGKA